MQPAGLRTSLWVADAGKARGTPAFVSPKRMSERSWWGPPRDFLSFIKGFIADEKH